MVYTLADGTQMTRRKKVVLTGAASGTLTDYQLKLAVTYAAAMQSDFDCLRFVKSDMQTLIDAWLETKTNDVSATVWAEFPTTPANGVDQDYYMYYGNAGAASDWDGAATFPDLFDDFDGASLDTDIWEVVGTPTITVSGSILTIENDTFSEYIRTKIYTTSYGKAIRTKHRDYTASYYPGSFSFGERTVATDVNYVAKCPYTADEWTLATNDGAGGESNTRLNEMSDNSYHLWDLTWLSNEAKLIKDGVTEGTNTLEIPSASIKVALGGRVYSAAGSTAYGSFDWVFVRKYAANPPTAAFGSEEHQRRTPMMM